MHLIINLAFISRHIAHQRSNESVHISRDDRAIIATFNLRTETNRFKENYGIDNRPETKNYCVGQHPVLI